MQKIVIIAGLSESLIGFRGDLIKSWINKGLEVYSIAPDNKAEVQLKELGVRKHYVVPIDRTGTNVLSDLKYLFKLKKCLKLIKPDITIGYTIKPVVYGSIAAKLAKVNQINAMVTGLGYLFVSDSFKAKMLQFIGVNLYRIGLKCANNAIFQNHDDMSLFVSRKIARKEKCHVVNGSGVNMELFKRSAFPEEFSFMMVSRLLYSKGVFEYFEAARIAKLKYPNIKFYMVGGFGNNADCIPKQMAQKYFDDGIINYLGLSNNIPETLKRCSVFVLPSYGEGTPRSVLEAMSIGRPILTTDVPGCRETVIEGENGFLVQHKNTKSLAEKMIWFIENKTKIEAMGDCSYFYCEKKFEVSKVNISMNKIMNI